MGRATRTPWLLSDLHGGWLTQPNPFTGGAIRFSA